MTPGLYSPWNSLGQNTGVGSLSRLQKIFPTQRANPGLPHCRQILYQLNHKGSLTILEWLAYAFSSGSSRPRNRTGVVSCIAGGFFANWAIREAHVLRMSQFSDSGKWLTWKTPNTSHLPWNFDNTKWCPQEMVKEERKNRDATDAAWNKAESQHFNHCHLLGRLFVFVFFF